MKYLGYAARVGGRTLLRGAIALGVGAAAIGLYAVFAPEVVDPPDAWDPPTPPALEGVLAPNTRLQRARLIARGKLVGPESIAIGKDGRLYTGTHDGRVLKIDVERDQVEVLARTGTAAAGCGKDPAVEASCGRVLGVRFDHDGNLIACDANQGLIRIDPGGRVTSLARSAPGGGPRFKFADDLDIARDGTIYFTNASTKYSQLHFRNEVLENGPYGQLLRYRPSTKETVLLLDALYFANGVQLSPDEDFVLIPETSRYRIRRYYLSGPKAGMNDIFADNLPGLPDNIRRGSKGRYWVALGAKRDVLLDLFHRRPWLKRAVAKVIPLDFFQEHFIPRIGLVVALDESGQIVDSLWDPDGQSVAQISEANEIGGRLYIGTIANDRIGVLDLAE